MAVKIGHARMSEDGTIVGKAGDQTGKEICITGWYNGGWNKLVRANDSSVAEKIAKAMEATCANDKIGYDQKERTTLYAEAKKKNWDIAKISTKCECDCSSLVAVCVNVAGIRVSKDIYTGNMVNALKNTGAFDVFTASKYLTSEAELRRGDILVKEGTHTAVVLTEEVKAPAKAEFKKGDIVSFTGELHYTSSASNATAKACKAGQAKVTAVASGKAHPYHLQAVAGKGSTVYGWVNAKDVTALNKTHTVKSGDTLSSIAKKYNTTVAELATLNGIQNRNIIRIGQIIKLP